MFPTLLQANLELVPTFIELQEEHLIATQARKLRLHCRIVMMQSLTFSHGCFESPNHGPLLVTANFQQRVAKPDGLLMSM